MEKCFAAKNISAAPKKLYPQKSAVLPDLALPATTPGSRVQVPGPRHTLPIGRYRPLHVLYLRMGSPCASIWHLPSCRNPCQPGFPAFPNTLTLGRKPDREKCASIFLDVTRLRLNQKGGIRKAWCIKGFPDPAALEKFGCGCFFSVSPGSFPRYLGFLHSALVSFRMALVSFQIALISFQIVLKTFHFRPWFLSAVDNPCFSLVLAHFPVDNYVDKMWITPVPEQQPSPRGRPWYPAARFCQACRL